MKKRLIPFLTVCIVISMLIGISASAWNKKCDDCGKTAAGLIGSGKCSECGGTGQIWCGNKNCHNGRVQCDICDGKGKVTCINCEGKSVRCNVCSGKGKIECAVCLGEGEKKCPICKECEACGGSGKCQTCGGSGTIDMGKWKDGDEILYPQYAHIYSNSDSPQSIVVSSLDIAKTVKAAIDSQSGTNESILLCENKSSKIKFYLPLSVLSEEEKKAISDLGDEQLKLIIDKLQSICEAANISDSNDPENNYISQITFPESYYPEFTVSVLFASNIQVYTTGGLYAAIIENNTGKVVSSAVCQNSNYIFNLSSIPEGTVYITDEKDFTLENGSENNDSESGEDSESGKKQEVYFSTGTKIIAVCSALVLFIIAFYMIWNIRLNKKYLKKTK